MKINKLLLVLFVTAGNIVQASLPDSVLHTLDEFSGGEKAFYLSRYVMDIYRYDKALALEAAGKGEQIANTYDDQKNLAEIYNVKGVVYGAYRKLDSSFAYYNKALEIATEHQFEEIITKVKMNTGINYFYQGDYENAMKYYHEVLNANEKSRDTVGIAYVASNIGFCYLRLKDLPTGIKYLKRALPLFLKNGKTINAVVTLNGIGAAYNEINSDSAIYYLKEGLKLLEGEAPSTIQSSLLTNLGNAYDDHQKALEVYSGAYEIAVKLDDKDARISALENVGLTKFKMGDYHGALESYFEELKLARESGLLHKQHTAVLRISNAYEALGEYQEALEYRKEYAQLDDSIFNEASEQNIRDLEIQYETKKKEQQLRIKELELQEKELQVGVLNWQLAGAGGGILILLLLLLLLKKRQKEARVKALAEKREAELKASIEGEEKERQRLGSELHDGLGQALSSIRIMVNNLKTGKEDPEVDQLLHHIDHTVSDLRSISHKLMPVTLVNHGLKEALEELVEKANTAGDMDVSLYTSGEDTRLRKDIGFLLYRITQELLNNAFKYANAGNISIQFMVDGPEMQLIVEDDGKGFDLSENINNGLGLQNIQSRVELHHGTVNIDTRPGHGTSVIIHLPVINN